MDLTPMVTTEVLTPEAQAYQTTMLQKPEEPIQEIWPVELQVATEVISIAIETEVTLAEEVSQLQAVMLKADNQQPAEDNRQLQLPIEIAPAELLLLLRQEEEPAEPMLQIVVTAVALNTATRNTKIANAIRKKLVIPVLPVEIPEVLHQPGLLVADLTIKDLPVHKVLLNREEQAPPRADSITSLHKPIRVRQPIPEAQAPQTATLHQQDLIHPDLILLQAVATATLQPEVAVAAPEVV